MDRTALAAGTSPAPRRPAQPTLEELELARQLKPLVRHITSEVVRSRVAWQRADIEDITQEVLFKLAGKLRVSSIEELLRLTPRAIRWRIAEYFRLKKQRCQEGPLESEPVARAEHSRPRFQITDSQSLFLTRLSPRQSRVCQAVLLGCTGVFELARVAAIPEREVGTTLAKVLFLAMESLPNSRSRRSC